MDNFIPILGLRDINMNVPMPTIITGQEVNPNIVPLPRSLEPQRLEFDNEQKVYAFKCPHCCTYVQVEPNQINCGIFRHGAFFTRNEKGLIIPTEPINPHMPKAECERLLAQGLVLGCTKPFRIDRNTLTVTECDYI